ncbi:MAG TPA: hypothetical protein VHC22_21130 [Pirellulales bacterium]|nr:hypothetical protein [Pirellulales bacterium]
MPKQFSLRLLLALVTAACIALGVWGMRAERQRRAVKAIEAVGGEVYYVSREPFLRRCLPRDYLGDVEVVSLSSTRVTDDFLAHLKVLTALQILHLGSTGITDAGMVHLEGLTKLQYLLLPRTRVTKDGVARLQKALPNCGILTSL